MSRALFRILASPLCLACVCGLGYWHGSVAPQPDGSQGAGAGFGWMVVHVAAPVAAIVFTVRIVAADRLAKLRSRPAFILL
ncbi:hypothetical protein [Luteolibacter sp. Populi]|uniref:hypothetical protein n=1 Tax=Luteolibacter sp. Populi TaxID=3230487 RepID=UPI00346558C9